MRRSLYIGPVLLLLFSFFVVPAATAADKEEDQPKKKKKIGVWFPANDFYPGYIADPLRPQNLGHIDSASALAAVSAFVAGIPGGSPTKAGS